MRRATVIFILSVFVLGLNVKANSLSQEDFLYEQAQLAGAEALEENMPEDTRDYLAERNISPADGSWAKSFNIGEIFSDLLSSVKQRARQPFVCVGLILAVILLSGALSTAQNGSTAAVGNFAVVAAAAAVISAPLLKVINSAVNVLQSISVFMTAFVPVFGAVVAVNGQAATSVSMSALLLGAAQAVELIAGNLVIPLMCSYLCINISAGVSPLLSQSNIGESVKRLAFWILSLTTTVFLGVLSIQTTISASGDSLSIKTARFVIGSSVPVAGTVLSEALTTVTASLGVLKTSVAIYGVVACCVIFLPFLLELLLWRAVLNLTAVAADVLGVTATGKLLKSVDCCIAVLCGILLLTGALFIISLTIVVSAGRG